MNNSLPEILVFGNKFIEKRLLYNINIIYAHLSWVNMILVIYFLLYNDFLFLNSNSKFNGRVFLEKVILWMPYLVLSIRVAIPKDPAVWYSLTMLLLQPMYEH